MNVYRIWITLGDVIRDFGEISGECLDAAFVGSFNIIAFRELFCFESLHDCVRYVREVCSTLPSSSDLESRHEVCFTLPSSSDLESRHEVCSTLPSSSDLESRHEVCFTLPFSRDTDMRYVLHFLLQAT